MERGWLVAQLGAGRSIEDIAREIGKDPSTVGYWVRKHALSSSHADKHASRGGIDLVVLTSLVERGDTVRGIAEELGVSFSTVQHWLRRYDLRTQRARQPRSADAREIERVCLTHGPSVFVKHSSKDHYRCIACRKERVVARRRAVKAMLVAEAGGSCVLCGYGRHPRALHFHHLDPAGKAFGLASAGVTRSLERSRAEARKCALLCSNCHAEVEDGVATIPSVSPDIAPG